MCGPSVVVFFFLEVVCFSVMYIVDNYVIVELHGSFKYTSFFCSEIYVELLSKTLASYFTAGSIFCFANV